jgi:hypothetical protein
MRLKGYFLLEPLAKSLVIYYVEAALSNGALGLGSNLWEGNAFYLLLEGKNWYVYIPKTLKG